MKTRRWLLIPAIACGFALFVLYFVFFSIGVRYGIVGDVSSFISVFLPLLLGGCILLGCGITFFAVKKHRWLCRVTALVLVMACACCCVVSDRSYTINDVIEGRAVEAFFEEANKAVDCGPMVETLLTEHEPAGYMQLVQFRTNDYYAAIDRAYEETGNPEYLYAFDVYVMACLDGETFCRTVPYAMSGFSFICILLCAFLAGEKKEKQKRNSGLFEELEERIELLHTDGILTDAEYNGKLDLLDKRRRNIG